MEPQTLSKQEQNQDIIACLSSSQSYIFIYPFTKQDAEAKNNLDDQVPDLLVFKNNDQITFEEIVSMYKQKFKTKTQTFQLCDDGSCFQLDDKIKKLKRKLRKTNIDGAKFYLYHDKQIFYNECCVTEALWNQKILSAKQHKLHFQILPIKYSIYLNVEGHQIEDIKYNLSLEIKRIWGKKVQPEMIDFLNEKDIQHFIDNQTTIEVRIVGLELPLPKENKNFLIIKQSSQLKIKAATFQLAAIESKKVIDLLKQLDPKRNWSEFGLKIADIILKPNQIIKEKCQILFEKSQIHTKHLIGLVAQELHIFQAERSKIEKNQFNLQSILVINEKNSQIRSKCEQEIHNRANNATHEYFKGNFQNVQPILLYTSELKVKPTNGNRESSIFRIVNQFLRKQNFAETTQSQYKTWQYIFQCHLLNKLSKIPPLKSTGQNNQKLKKGWTDKVLWRGESYKHQYEVGQTVHFKQFTSSTEKQSVAEGFASECIFKITMSKSGRSIQEFSIFIEEAQVLFPSYTKFLVTNKETYKNPKKNKEIICYEMQEVEVQPLPAHQANFILWVDDKTLEGKKMWSQFKNFEHTTVMHQLVSTEQLQKWLSDNKKVYKVQKDSAQLVNVAMISNMTRKQKGKQNTLAGVDAIKVFRDFLPQGNIFLYIGNRKVALQKLENAGLFPSDSLKVSSIPQQLKNFLKNNIKID